MPAHVKKLNKFSLRETVRIKKDAQTIRGLKKMFFDDLPFKVKPIKYFILFVIL